MQEAHLTKLDNCNEDDFEKLKLISNGSYCAVHLIRHKLSGVPYAMKVFRKNKLKEKSQIKKVLSEQFILKSLDNPFIVGLVCSFQTEKNLCMVMEYVPGGDVASLIKKVGPLSKDLSKTYLAETTLAVEYLHSLSVLHLDLKPNNLLITFSGHIKVADFGLSQMLSSDEKDLKFDENLYFAPQYVAPEFILKTDYGKPVDWWSMGILLYEFLTSFPPFGGKTIKEITGKILNGAIVWPEEDDKLDKIPEEAKNLVKSLLDLDPSKRLGARGAIEIKEHPFFNLLEWDHLLEKKPEFVPVLKGPYDTECFDSRSDIFNHDSTSPTITKSNDIQKKYFSKFSSCSSKNNLNNSNLNVDESLQSALNKPQSAVSQSPAREKFKLDTNKFGLSHLDDKKKVDLYQPQFGQIPKDDKLKQFLNNSLFGFSQYKGNDNLKQDSNKPLDGVPQLIQDDQIVKQDSNKTLEDVSKLIQDDQDFKQDSKKNVFDFSQYKGSDIFKQDSNKPLEGVPQLIQDNQNFKQDSKKNAYDFSRFQDTLGMLPDNENLKKDSNQPPIDFSQIQDDQNLKQVSNKPLEDVPQLIQDDQDFKQDSYQHPIDFPKIHNYDILKQDSKNNSFAFSKLINKENLKKDSNKGHFAYQKENERLKIKRSKENLNKSMGREELIIAKSEILEPKEGNEPTNESNSDITKLELNFNFSLSF